MRVCNQLHLDCDHAPAVFMERDAARQCTKHGFDRFLTPGAVGCYHAHANVWEEISQLPGGFHMIMEDDVAMPRAKPHAVRAAVADHLLANTSKDVVHFGTFQERNLLAAHAYAITPEGARKLLEFAPACGEIKMPIDRVIRTACKEGHVDCATALRDMPGDHSTQYYGLLKQMKTNASNPSFIQGQ